MKKVNTFIREVNLKLCRKLRVISPSEAGKRFVIDNNAHSFSALSEDTHANQWGLSIEKWHGKYIINRWSNCWDDYDIVVERVSVTSDDRKVIKLINAAVDDGYEAFWIKDKHLNSLKWYIPRETSELYDDEEEVDCGELPQGFEPLEAVPEELAI